MIMLNNLYTLVHRAIIDLDQYRSMAYPLECEADALIAGIQTTGPRTHHPLARKDNCELVFKPDLLMGLIIKLQMVKYGNVRLQR